MKHICFAICFLSATITNKIEPTNRMIIWNVGQGQWVTYSQIDTCEHFDSGGDKIPWKQIKNECSGKLNVFFLSHWDWDHIGGVKQIKKYLANSCLALPPNGSAPSNSKEFVLQMPECMQFQKDKWIWQNMFNKKKSSNEQSSVVLYKNFLFPGDSPAQQEMTWGPQLPKAHKIVLILGHHGSKSSTSEYLLNNLSIRQSISSARWKRYHHPHPQVLARLQIKKIPNLRTEDWGHIIFQIN